jgi:hypothetical protein
MDFSFQIILFFYVERASVTFFNDPFLVHLSSADFYVVRLLIK